MSGVALHAVRHGEGAPGTPLLIAHGLFGSARNWGVIAKRLSDARPVTAVDMRNHGASPFTDTHGYDDLAADLAGALGDGPADVLGHSMGGKAAMILALSHPERVRRLVVADIAPVGYGHSQGHLIEAMRAVDPAAVSRRSEADARLADAVPDPTTRAFLLQSLDVKAGAWTLNLDTIEREMERIVGWPGAEGRFDGPALFLAGAESDYVRPEHRDGIRALFPRARIARIPDAGHWLHAERPREFEAAVRTFLDS
jgi:pimeloyl-ACP methyl ester carboxylesterase